MANDSMLRFPLFPEKKTLFSALKLFWPGIQYLQRTPYVAFRDLFSLNFSICLYYGVSRISAPLLFLIHLNFDTFLCPTFLLLQVFSAGIMDNFSMLQSRVVRLEDVVDRLAQDLVHREEFSGLATSKLLKQDRMLHSPRLSACTPRPSVDIQNRQPSALSVKSNEIWEENAFDRSLTNTSSNRRSEMWANAKVNARRNPTGVDIQKSLRQGTGTMGYGQVRNDPIFGSTSRITTRKNGLENKNNLWKRVKGFLSEGDVDSAYVEALCSGDEHVLMELFDMTGPVLECLSSKNVSDVLSTLGSYLLEQKFTATIVPWLQQASLFYH